MAKNDKVAQARKLFVQARAEKTGQTTAEAKAKYRQRFEKLASTKEGRAKIQQVTGLQGVRKELASTYGKKPSTSTTKTTTTTTPTATTPTATTPSAPSNKTSVDRLPSSSSSAKQTTTSVSPRTTTTSVPPTPVRSGPYENDRGLSGIQKLLIGGGAAAVVGSTLRRLNLDRIAKANAANVPAQAKNIVSPSPQKKSPTSGPKNRKTTGPRPSSASARARARGGSSGGGGGGPRGTDDRQVVQ